MVHCSLVRRNSRGSYNKEAEFKIALPYNRVVYALGISLSCSYTGDARDEEEDLEHFLEHAFSSYYLANPGE
ncbi:hypothetical protein Tco_1419859 [Tanacetum coccineum]